MRRNTGRLASGVLAVVLVAELALCVAHMATRLPRDVDPSTWPRVPSIEDHAWIERTVRGLDSIGTMHHGVPREVVRERARLETQYAVAPTRVLDVPGDVNLVVIEPWVDRDEAADELAAEGWADVRFGPRRSFGLAARERLPDGGEVRDLVEHGVRGRTVFALVLLLLPVLVAALRGGLLLGSLTLLAGLPALGLASAVADATTAPAVVVAVVYLALMASWLALTRPVVEPPGTAPSLGRVGVAAVTVLVVLGLLDYALRAAMLPFGHPDALYMFEMRARFIVGADDFLAPFRMLEHQKGTHEEYPPLVAFAVAGGYRLAGGFSTFVAMVLQALPWLGFTGLAVHRSLRTGGRLLAIAVLALLVLAPFVIESVAHRICDLPLGLFFGGALLAWRWALDGGERSRRWAAVGGVFLGAAACTKNEGLLMVAAWTAALVVSLPRADARHRRLVATHLGAAAPLLAIVALFKWNVPANDLVAGFSLDSATWSRVDTIARDFGGMLVSAPLYKCLFAVVGVSAVVWLVRSRREGGWGVDERFVARAGLVLVVVLVGDFCAYLFTPYDVYWHLRTSSNRVILQLYPAALVLGIALASRVSATARGGGRASPAPIGT